jgi:hypothetical protein
MGTFNIISSQLNNQYEFQDENLKVTGAFAQDATNNQLQNINGSCYEVGQGGQPGNYVGNFQGYMRDGEVKYSISEMSRRNANKVWNAIDEIESHILPQNEE